MSDLARHRAFVESTRLSAEEISRNSRQIRETLLAQSPYLDGPNFTQLHPDDLQLLFEECDRQFVEGRCRQMLGDTGLHFRISSRMTKAGGKTARYQRRGRPEDRFFEMVVSSTLLFQTFHDDERPIIVTGIKCRNRLEALQRIIEHELTHLIELLLWEASSCAGERFQSMASRFFGHTDHRHQLVTPLERAVTKFGISPGTRVRFRIDGAEYIGLVNRITKRATVLVEDGRGPQYSDGKRYAKFYVPLAMLEPVK